MKRTIRVTESELRGMISESIMNIMNEAYGDWNSLESNNYVTIGGKKYNTKDYQRYKKNKKDNESFEEYTQRIKDERKAKSAATRAAKAAEKKDREEAKKLGLTIKKYKERKENGTLEKAVAESLRRVLKSL